jgi:hypothetical protein
MIIVMTTSSRKDYQWRSGGQDSPARVDCQLTEQGPFPREGILNLQVRQQSTVADIFTVITFKVWKCWLELLVLEGVRVCMHACLHLRDNLYLHTC